MPIELLTPQQMAEVDRQAILRGPLDGPALMRAAGHAVAAEVLRRYPHAAKVHILCGPGNNGGDGYVIATLLQRTGANVALWAGAPPRPRSDAAIMAADCPVASQQLEHFSANPSDVVVDSLYGAGLAKPLAGVDLLVVQRIRAARCPVVSVDLPSGVSGESGEILGEAISADVTVTFVRKKPGHLLYPGRLHCGELIVADIGIPDVGFVGSTCFENLPSLWFRSFPRLRDDTHKYRRGHVAVFSGGPTSTGAARMAAMAAARAGAGAVTLLSPLDAVAINAAHLTSVILRQADGMDDVDSYLAERKPQAIVYGPGLGAVSETGERGIDLIDRLDASTTVVLDADAITMFAKRAETLFDSARRANAPQLVLTPHAGEFARLFPDIAGDASLSKLDRARRAAERSNATIVFKGPDTVIASADGRVAINSNGTPLLATAGSGDILAGIIAGLVSQSMPVFEAACAGVWIHAEAARAAGIGLIAEDLPDHLPAILRGLTAAGAMP